MRRKTSMGREQERPVPVGAGAGAPGRSGRTAGGRRPVLEPMEPRLLLDAGPVVINELMYHPGFGDYGQAGYVPESIAEEYIELYNRGSTDVNLEGWRLTQGVSFTFPNVTLGAGQYLVVAADVAAFQAKYPTVTNVVGGWTGHLSNSGEDVELEDALGNRMDFVSYADEGDWALRRRDPVDPAHPTWFRGWHWETGADAGRKSLELISAGFSNEYGQNWSASTVDQGTPGGPNSVAAPDIAPVILDVEHLPNIPRSTDPVTVRARIVDELGPAGAAMTLYWRLDGGTTFASVVMFDDGAHGDGAAGDGVFTGVIPAQPNLAVVEFYVEASDAGGKTRTWPAPSDDLGNHGANLLYQVDNSYNSAAEWTPGAQPIYRLVIPAAEFAQWKAQMDAGHPGDYSDAQMNASFITLDGVELNVRYQAGVRNRGEGTRSRNPHNYRVNLPHDTPWKGLTAVDFNTQYTQCQVAGNAIFQFAGLPAADGAPVVMLTNGVNLANAGSPQFGSYFRMSPYNGEFLDAHLPLDAAGNLYKGVATSSPDADLRYISENPDSYRMSYTKQTNAAADDWTDLIGLVRTLNQTPDAEYTAAVSAVVNVDEWMEYFAVNMLVGNRENSMGGVGSQNHYQGDDYSLYIGLDDPRAMLFVHDLDTVLGQGDYRPAATSTPEGLFPTSTIPALARFLKWKDFAPRLYAAYMKHINTTFAPENIGPLLDQLLGGWIPESTVQAMKDYAAARVAHIRTLIPQALTVTSTLSQQSGYYRTTTSTASLSGVSNAVETRAVLVNGVAATWSAWEAKWTATGVALAPGLNRVIVQALGADGAQIERKTLDIWYDTGVASDVGGTLPAGTTTWTAANGPYRVTANLTVPAGATLVIEPGTSVFFNTGTYLTINGKLDARGTDLAHVRLTVTPGGTNWAGLRFVGGPEPSLISYADIEYSSGSDSIDASGTAVHLDHITWAYQGSEYYLDWHNSSIILTNSILPAISSHELFHFSGFPAGGYALVQGNYFGGTTGYNDIIDFTGGQRPGPIARFIGNVFDGGSDDVLDLDGTDAYIAGNIFVNIHQDGARESKSYCITTGSNGSDVSQLTVIGNIFYDVDHALLCKDGGFITAINNTIVNVRKTHADATTAVISFFENRSGQWPGVGAYLEGNIIYGAENLWENLNDLSTTTYLVANRNIFYNVASGVGTLPGVGNLVADPRLVNTTNVTDPWQDFRLRPGSPAFGAGPNGADMGALAGYLATLAGEPLGTTWRTDATLTVGGPDIYGYKYRVEKDGAWLGDWSAEVPLDWTIPTRAVSSITRTGSVATATVPAHGFSAGDIIIIEGAGQREYNGPFTISNVTADTFDYTVSGTPTTPATGTLRCWKAAAAPAVPPIELAGLEAGTYRVHVIRKDSAGFWQGEAEATVSRAWTVDPAHARLRINEVLASNVAAVEHGAGQYPDLVELVYDASPGSPALDLGDMSLTDNLDLPRKFVFAPGTLIQPGEHLTLYADSDTLTPGIHLGFSVKASGDDLYLFDTTAAGGGLVDSVVFGFQLADQSLSRKPDGSWGLGAPTFGAANTLLTLGDPSTLRINEWLASGDVLFKNDFIEIHNPDPLPVDMGGLYLTDQPMGWPDRHRVAPLSFVAGSGMAVFAADGDPVQGADHLNFRLSSYQGLIALADADLRRLDQVWYGPQTTDVSEGRTPDAASTFIEFALPHPGVSNPGITEIITGTTYTLVAWDATWRYNQSRTDLGTAWREPGYDDSVAGWLSGQGVLAYESATLAYPIKTTLDRGPSSDRTPTFYFRIHFTLPVDPATLTFLELRTLIDDGAVVYVNGNKLSQTLGMPTNVAISYSTYTASGGANGRTVGDAAVEGPFAVPLAFVHQGDNVLAVEVHQCNNTSSDVVWGGELRAGNQEVTYVITNPIPDRVVDLMAGLRITELMYSPPGGKDYEYIELQNVGSVALDLEGVRLDSAVQFTFPAWTLDPGAYVLVVNHLAAFESRYGTGRPVAGQYGLAGDKLSDNGENVILRLPAPYDAAMLRFDYSGTWYPTTNDLGYSLVVVDPAARPVTWRDRDAWRPSVAYGGSPGADEPVGAGDVVISEVLAHSDLALGDWIELHNTTGADIDIGGWTLSDSALDLAKYQIQPGTVIPAHGYIVFNERDHFGNPAAPGVNVVFGLSELGEEVHLTSPAVHQFVVFGASDREVAFGRYPTSTGAVDFVPMSAATPEEPNAYPLVGPVVISELMYNPLSGYYEYIELQNTSTAAVPLYDPAYPANTWKFTDGVTFAFPVATVLAPGERVLVVATTNVADFRLKYSVPAGVRLFGPYTGALNNGGEAVTLSRPGTPEPITGFVPYYRVDSVTYDNNLPWPIEADGGGAALERVVAAQYGNDVANWAAGPLHGTAGRENAAVPPRVTAVRLNARDGRGVSALDPSGAGVRTLEVTFSEPVAFSAADVLVQTVSLAGGVETITGTITPDVVSGSGTAAMTVTLPAGAALDTWVKVTLRGNGTLRDLSGRRLDGEPNAGGSGLGYLAGEADLPTGDRVAGGHAVFYVGSLRGDADADRVLTSADIDAFLAKYGAGDLDADFRGVGFGSRTPDGAVTPSDVAGFLAVYQAGVAAGRSLAPLPGAGGGLAAPAGPTIAVSVAPSPVPAVSGETRPVAPAGGPADAQTSDAAPAAVLAPVLAQVPAAPAGESALAAPAAEGLAPAQDALGDPAGALAAAVVTAGRADGGSEADGSAPDGSAVAAAWDALAAPSEVAARDADWLDVLDLPALDVAWET